MYIQNIAASEFRCFQTLDLDLNYPGKALANQPRLPNVTLLLGNNGSGKSAVMKALAWGPLSQVMSSSGLQPRYFVRRELDMPPTKNASVTAKLLLHEQDQFPSAQPIESYSQGVVQLVQTTETFISTAVTGDALSLPIYDENSPANFIVGYGATRRSEAGNQSDPTNDSRRSPRYMRVASLFEDNVPLVSTSVALARMAAENRLAEVAQIMNGLLPDPVKLNSNYNPKEPEFFVGDVGINSPDLSDGFRAFGAWALDLLFHLTVVAPPNTKLAELKGVVIIDEIDLHLHPKWQRNVVESAALAFPNLQFIISSHSPLVVGSLESSNILFAVRDGFELAKEHVSGLSSDQLLTSAYFGLPSPRSVEAVERLTQLAEDAFAGNDEAAITFLNLLSEGIEKDRQQGQGGQP